VGSRPAKAADPPAKEVFAGPSWQDWWRELLLGLLLGGLRACLAEPADRKKPEPKHPIL
jgi:hypothetical protein